MGYEKLAKGYRKVINAVYSPELYYQRVKAFLKEYRPLEKRKRHIDLRYLRSHFSYFGAPVKSMVVLGIKDKARLYYWKLLFWSLFRRPRLFPMALTYSIYGFHFRKVFGDHR